MHNTIDVGIRAACDMVGMSWRFVHVENGRKTNFLVFEQFAPFGSTALGESLFKCHAERRPALAVVLPSDPGWIEIHCVDELCKKF